MKTRIRTIGDTVVVDVEGKLSFESQEPLKTNLTRFLDHAKTDSTPSKFIFNLKNLEFVGSSGISSFIQTLKTFSENLSTRPKYCHVQSEFKKVIQAFDDEKVFEFYENEESAKKSFDH